MRHFNQREAILIHPSLCNRPETVLARKSLSRDAVQGRHLQIGAYIRGSTFTINLYLVLRWRATYTLIFSEISGVPEK